MNDRHDQRQPGEGTPPECAETRERLHEWVDRELDRDIASRVAKHVDGCMACTEITRSIQSLKQLLRTKARTVQTPPRLESKVREAIALETLRAERARIIHLPRPRARWVAAAALLLVMIPFAMIGLRNQNLHADVTEEAFNSHMLSVAMESMPRYQCMSQEEAEKNLAEELGLDVRLPQFKKGRVCLKGVTYENLGGVKAGKLFYHLDGEEFSLFVVPQKMRGGNVLCCCRNGNRYNVFCSNEGEYCFTYVTKLDGERFRQEVLEPALDRAIEFSERGREKLKSRAESATDELPPTILEPVHDHDHDHPKGVDGCSTCPSAGAKSEKD